MTSTLRLGYWDIRGFAEPIRLLLKYLNVPYEDVRYGFGDGEAFPSREEWLQEKFVLGLDFPNLPYLIDGGFKITQSVVILKYLARKYDLLPTRTDLKLIAQEEMIEAQIIDIRNRLISALVTKSYTTSGELAAEIDLIQQDLQIALTQLEMWIGDKQWLVEQDKLSYVDFLAYEYLDWFRDLVQSNCMERYPKLSSYMRRFEQLPALKQYLDSDEYRRAHILTPAAKMGYRFNR